MKAALSSAAQPWARNPRSDKNEPFSPGMAVTSKLRLIKPIGKGGMGTVWAAHHAGLGCQVAIKLLTRAAVGQGRDAPIRFRREVTLCARLNSPHAVRIYDSGLLANGTPYIVMELLAGESLGRRLLRVGSLDHDEILTLMKQAALVLTSAHTLGIVHRDIKPANLHLVDGGGALFLKLLDFGIAKTRQAGDCGSVTATGAFLGSPKYMSPEQIRDPKRVDHRCDLWSLAVVIYHALTGVRPFQGDTLGEVLMAVLDHQYQPASTTRTDLPPAIDQWFERAFYRDIDDRFQTSAEMAEALERALRPKSPGTCHLDEASEHAAVQPSTSIKARPRPAPRPSSNAGEPFRRVRRLVPPGEKAADSLVLGWEARSPSSGEPPTPRRNFGRAVMGLRMNGRHLLFAALALMLGAIAAVASHPTAPMLKPRLNALRPQWLLSPTIVQPPSMLHKPALPYQSHCADRALGRCLHPPGWPGEAPPPPR